MQEQVRYESQWGNVSTAHDLSAYDARTTKQARSRVVSIVQKRRKRMALRNMLKNVLLCCFGVAMLSGILISATQLNELTARASSLKSENEELLSEQKRLMALYDMQLDLAEIENIATEQLYMQKLEQEQIVYVRLTGDDYATVVEEQDSLVARAFDALRGISLHVAEWME